MYQDKTISFQGKGRKLKAKIYPKEAQALKDIRISKGKTREEIADYLDCAKFTIERKENGRLNFNENDIRDLLRKYRITRDQFESILKGEVKIPKYSARSVYKTIKNNPKTYRRYRKEITKEARVLRVMRKMKKLSKSKAGKLSGMHPSCIDHRENGRANISKEDIRKLVLGYGFKMRDFYELMDQPILRDELVEECIQILKTIENDKLKAVRALLANF